MTLRTELVFEMQDSRDYMHGDCRAYTRIDGSDFRMLADPDRMCGATYCATCRRAVPLDTVFWADTGESIKQYRKGVKRALEERTPFWVESLAFTLPLGGVVICGVVSALLMRDELDVGITIAAIALSCSVAMLLGMVVGAFIRARVHAQILRTQFNAMPHHIVQVTV